MPFPRLTILALLLTAGGCVERTINISSEPPGALVYLNDTEVGRTPVIVPFNFYGVYDVRLEHEQYQPLWTKMKADAPWWEATGPDLVGEAIPHHKVRLDWHFTMQPSPPLDESLIIDHADQMRAIIQKEAAENR